MMMSRSRKNAVTSCLCQMLSCPRALWFTIRSLTYNTHTSADTVLDSAFEPVFWVVDNYTGVLGPAFVVMVLLLTASVVIIYYTTLFPVVIAKYSHFWITVHLVFGHWLLVNILFNYLMVSFSSPGNTPQGERVKHFEHFDICKKCVQPKPPRAHHCSVCKKCVLKMDHHCPWVNNCVGHFNQRYFLLFCVYMTMGTIYVSYVSLGLFKYHFFHPGGPSGMEVSQALSWVGGNLPFRFNLTYILSKHNATQGNPDEIVNGKQMSPMYVHNTVTYEFILCSAVTVALGILLIWHVRLVWKGETSIEVHVNKKKAKELKERGRKFKNPYDYGVRNNFKMMLGLVHGRTVLRILFPSLHKPYGDGMSWPAPPSEDIPKKWGGAEKVHEV